MNIETETQQTIINHFRNQETIISSGYLYGLYADDRDYPDHFYVIVKKLDLPDLDFIMRIAGAFPGIDGMRVRIHEQSGYTKIKFY